MNPHDPVTSEECRQVLEKVYAFLDHELDTASGDAIREHLHACEPCLERFDVEQALKSLIARRCGGDVAPTTLRTRILVQLRASQGQ